MEAVLDYAWLVPLLPLLAAGAIGAFGKRLLARAPRSASVRSPSRSCCPP